MPRDWGAGFQAKKKKNNYFGGEGAGGWQKQMDIQVDRK